MRDAMHSSLDLVPISAGDSLLFASGAFAALGSLDLVALMAVFISSAILGDAVNYSVGKWLGETSLGGRKPALVYPSYASWIYVLRNCCWMLTTSMHI